MEPIVPAAILKPIQGFLDLLEHWNARHALTALAPEDRFEELVQDACALLPHLEAFPEGSRLVDFGTGMGIPALVLALARPDLHVIAIDKSMKKMAFVRQAILELRLDNLHPTAGRCEALPPLNADLGTAKAVGSLPLLTSWWDRHGKPGAPLLLLKSEASLTEPCPEGWQAKVFPYALPHRGQRTLLRLTKEPGR